MLIKYLRPFVMCLLLALTVTPTTFAQKKQSAAFKKCAGACRETYLKAKHDCKSKAGAERTTCKNAAKQAARKCQRGCPE